MQREGGWVFISHSHLDIEIVRKIRNQLETQGFDPLMFYLKCLNDDNEIESLIKREIAEREWFIYVESKNAKKSRWVKSERKYIAQLKGKKIFTIDINRDVAQQVDVITRQLKIFMSYSYLDSKLCDIIKQYLIKKDFLVLLNGNNIMENDWIDGIRTKIAESARDGFVLLLLTENTNKSHFVLEEIEYAKKAGGKIIPIFVGDVTLNSALNDEISGLNGIKISITPTEEELSALVYKLNQYMKYASSDFQVIEDSKVQT